MRRPRILMADDHALMLDGLRKLLQDEFTIVGAVSDGRALIAAASTARADVILVDISMPLLNGIDAIRQLREIAPKSRIVVLTMHADSTYAVEAFKAGAQAYVVKQSAATDLVHAIRAVLAGQRYVAPSLRPSVLATSGLPETPRAGRLTPRQREVLQLVAEGRSVKEIAAVLGVSLKTVEFHKGRIMNQLGLRRTADLTRYALAHGLVAI